MAWLGCFGRADSDRPEPEARIRMRTPAAVPEARRKSRDARERRKSLCLLERFGVGSGGASPNDEIGSEEPSLPYIMFGYGNRDFGM